MTNIFEEIQNEINKLKYDPELAELANKLHDQLHTASSAKWSVEDLSELIKSESDVLDLGIVDEETELWSDIRNIQDSIINSFADFQE